MKKVTFVLHLAMNRAKKNNDTYMIEQLADAIDTMLFHVGAIEKGDYIKSQTEYCEGS